jgi:hypothetical protein
MGPHAANASIAPDQPSPINYSLNAQPGTRDLIAVTSDTTQGKYVKGTLMRDINVTSAMGLDMDFNNLPGNHIDSFATHNLTATTEAGATLPYATAGFTSKNGAVLWLSDFQNKTWQLPSIATIPGDMFSFEGIASNQAGTETRWMLMNTGHTPPSGDVDLDLASINPFTGAAITLAGASGLSYAPRAGGPALRAYALVYQQFITNPVTTGADAFTFRHSISLGWLGNASSFSLPNLATVAGFNPAWSLRQGEDTYSGVEAIMANVPTSTLAQYWLNYDEVPGMQIETVETNITLVP